MSVISLYKRKFPKLTEEIIKKLNIRVEPKTKENYIRTINKAAMEILVEKFRKELMEQVLDWFVKNSKVEISERTLHRLIERNFKGYDYNKARLEVLRDLVKERMVKFVSKREGIEVLEEDIEEARDILKSSGIPEEVIDILNVNYDKPDFLKRIVLERKVFDFIIEHANIV